MHKTWRNLSVCIAKRDGGEGIEFKAGPRPLQCGDEIVAPLGQQVDRLASQLRGIKTVKVNRPPAALRVAYFSREDGRIGGVMCLANAEELVAQRVRQHLLQRFGRPAELHIAGRINAAGHLAQPSPLGIHNALADHNHHMLLTLVQFANALFQRGEIQRRFGNENHVGLTIGRPERDEPCLPMTSIIAMRR